MSGLPFGWGRAVLGILAFAGVASLARGQSYSWVDLGSLGGGSTLALGLNRAGAVVGESLTATGETHAFLFRNGAIQDLGTLGGAYSSATCINDSTTVVGFSLTAGGGLHGAPGDLHAFSFNNGLLLDLGTLGGNPLGGTGSMASSINAQGVIVGVSGTAGNVSQHAFRRVGGVMMDLGTLDGGTSCALDINSTGRIVGFSQTGSGQRAFVYEGGVMVDAGDLGGPTATANAVNDAGVFAGSSETGAGGGYHAFRSTSVGLEDLGTLGGAFSVAYDVNLAGAVVGWATTADETQRAFVVLAGEMVDLNEVVTLAGVILTEARGINELGQIVAQGSNGHGYLLTLVSNVPTCGRGHFPQGHRPDRHGWHSQGGPAGGSFGQKKSGHR